jgi:hypothetical protein
MEKNNTSNIWDSYFIRFGSANEKIIYREKISYFMYCSIEYGFLLTGQQVRKLLFKMLRRYCITDIPTILPDPGLSIGLYPSSEIFYLKGNKVLATETFKYNIPKTEKYSKGLYNKRRDKITPNLELGKLTRCIESFNFSHLKFSKRYT